MVSLDYHPPLTGDRNDNEIAGTPLTDSRADGMPHTANGRAKRIYRDGLKRGLDVTLVVIAAPIIALVVIPLAVAVAIEGGSPFYTQNRVGLNGRIYRMWKLRTMVKGADELLDAWLAGNPEARAEWDRTQKLVDDPRITKFGKALRRTSLDELPQLWNVLIGDMSLIGPRPMMPCQRQLYPGAAYYRMLPGITGPWQVSQRNKSSFADRAIYDEEYEASLSLTADVSILIKTVGVIFVGTGC